MADGDPAYSHVDGSPIYALHYGGADPAYRVSRRYVEWSSYLHGAGNLDGDFAQYAPDPLHMGHGTRRIPPDSEPTIWLARTSDRVVVPGMSPVGDQAWAELRVDSSNATLEIESDEQGVQYVYPVVIVSDSRANIYTDAGGGTPGAYTGAYILLTSSLSNHNPLCTHQQQQQGA